MNLLFENLFKRIESITFEQIKFEYWDYSREAFTDDEIDPMAQEGKNKD